MFKKRTKWKLQKSFCVDGDNMFMIINLRLSLNTKSVLLPFLIIISYSSTRIGKGIWIIRIPLQWQVSLKNDKKTIFFSLIFLFLITWLTLLFWFSNQKEREREREGERERERDEGRERGRESEREWRRERVSGIKYFFGNLPFRYAWYYTRKTLWFHIIYVIALIFFYHKTKYDT